MSDAPDPQPNDRYRAGRVDAELAGMNRRLDEITTKLDRQLEWQQRVETRLATGAEKFESIEGTLTEHGTAIENLKDARRGIIGVASAIGGAIGTAAAAAIKFWTGNN